MGLSWIDGGVVFVAVGVVGVLLVSWLSATAPVLDRLSDPSQMGGDDQ